MKVCTKCKIEKPLTEYHNKINTSDGKACRCKGCNQSKPKTKERACLDSKNWALRNPEKIKQMWSDYYDKNKEKLKIKRKSYVSKTYPTSRETNKRYREKNRDLINQRRRLKRKNPTPKMIIEKSLRNRFNKVIIHMKSGTKHTSCINLIGCDFDTVKYHIESQFTEGMNWNNHGNGAEKWNIDHIIPLVQFNLHDLDQQKVAFHYTNLRPLWFLENLSRKRKHYNKKDELDSII